MQLLGHLLGQRRHEHALVSVGPHPDLFEQVVDLALAGLDDDLRVDQAGRADDLLDHPVGDAHLVAARRRRQVDLLADAAEELLPPQRAVVERARQPEPVLDQCALAARVALVHRADLRHRDVRLVDDHQEVVGEVVEQRVRRLAGDPAVDVPRVVLDAVAEADLLHHLEVEAGAHAQPLGLEQLALALELGQALRELGADRDQRALQGLGAGGVVGRREDGDRVQLLDHIAGQRMQRVQRLDLVAEHLDADRVLLVDRDDLDGVAAHAELAAREVDVVALVLHVDEAAHQLVARDVLADLQRRHRAQVLLGCAESVDARDRRDHDDVAAAEQRSWSWSGEAARPRR